MIGPMRAINARSLEPEKLVLVLQGGGALGAYQAGAYEALHEAGLLPDWVAGISIGAINGAIIAGNPPEARLAKLRAFWEQSSSWLQGDPPLEGTHYREFFNYVSAATVSAIGVPGFFEPRIPPASVMPPGSPAALSIYDSAPLRGTLRRLVDFAYLKRQQVRLSVGAVNIRTGNFIYFDSHDDDIAPEHIMASGALPPGLPPIEIDGEYYWDGGIYSNTPLHYVLKDLSLNALVVQVDLFNSEGELPQNLDQVQERTKDLQYQSKLLVSHARIRELEALRSALGHVLAKLPRAMQSDPEVQKLAAVSQRGPLSLVHLVNRHDTKSSDFKDYEFSRATVEDLWQAGHDDVRMALMHPERAKVTDFGNSVRAYEL